MPYIDFRFILDGKFAKLKPSTRILLHVITGVCNCKTGVFHHSVEKLADLSGISRSAAQRGLRELEQHNPPIILTIHRPGKPATKVHIPTAIFTGQIPDTPAMDTGPPVTDTGVPRSQIPGSPVEKQQQNQSSSPSAETPNSPKQQQSFKQQTTTSAANRISKRTIKYMIGKYGAEIVTKVVVAMQKLNGEIKDADAYFAACVRHNWIPTSRTARQLEQKKAQAEQARKRQEKEAAQFQKMVHDSENCDPDVAAREIAKINAILGN